ncbi:MAG: hypothetical protein HY445_02870 [Candidatus Niyogibacteria bacterium]|nr:hypothetical protein [Candidatus Niyogibacteria bacterium]
MKDFTGVIFTGPFGGRRPVLHGIAAYFYLSLFLEKEIGELAIEFSDQPVNVSQCVEEGKFPLLRGTGALRAVFNHFGQELTLDADKRIMAIFEKNDKDGHLRSYPYSITWLCRQAYRLGYDPAEVVVRAADVVRAFRNNILDKKEVPNVEAFSDILSVIKSSFQPFSLSRYLRDLVSEGVGSENVRSRIEWFYSLHKRAEQEQEKALHVAPAYISVGSEFHIGYFVTDNKFVADVNQKKYDVLAIRDAKTKNAIIFFDKKFSSPRSVIAPILQKLQAGEEERWKVIPDRYIVANGTESSDAIPTERSDQDIFGIIKDVLKKFSM